MGSVVSGISNIWGGITGQSAKEAGQQSSQASLQSSQDLAKAIQEASGKFAGTKTSALDYLKQQEALPTQIRQGALGQLAGLYGLPGGTGDQASFIQAAKQSPLYQSLLNQGQEAVLRNAAATGGLRSGNVQTALATNAENVLNSVYGQRLAGLTGLLGQTPDVSGTITSAMLAPAQTQYQGALQAATTTAQGQTAAAQEQQQAAQGYQQNLFGLAGAGLKALSDIRMKKNIKFKGEVNGHAWFEWEWNQKALKYGYSGKAEGVMAHFVYETNPDAISTYDGVLIVDYAKLGFERIH